MWWMNVDEMHVCNSPLRWDVGAPVQNLGFLFHEHVHKEPSQTEQEAEHTHTRDQELLSNIFILFILSRLLGKKETLHMILLIQKY